MNSEIMKLQSVFAQLTERILPCELIAIVNVYVRSLYDGQYYKHCDLLICPKYEPCMFLLNLEVEICNPYFPGIKYMSYKGEVNVIRHKEYNFMFEMNGKTHIFTDGKWRGDGEMCICFDTGIDQAYCYLTPCNTDDLD